MPCGSSLVRSRQWGLYDFKNRQVSGLFDSIFGDHALVQCHSASAGLNVASVRVAFSF